MGTDFIRAPSKASLLALLKSAKKLDARLLSRLFDGVMFKSEYKDSITEDVTTVVSDVTRMDRHGDLSGLLADDHTQYILGDRDDWTDLTDAGETTLHTHANIQDGPWLPIVAGSSNNLTGDLYVESAVSGAKVSLTDTSGSGDGYSTFLDEGHTFAMLKTTNTGDSLLRFDFSSGDGVSDYFVDLFAATSNTTGEGLFRIYEATGALSLQHSLKSTGDVDLCQQGGQLTVGGTAGASTLSVVGSVAATVTTQTAATLTLTGAHYTVLCDATSNTVTITLPSAVGVAGRMYNIKCINDDNAVELAADGTEEIDGSTTNIALILMETVTVQSDNANWWII